MTVRVLCVALVILLAACGKKGEPRVPMGEKSTYPHPYPVAAPVQNSTPSVPGGAPADETAPVPASPPDDKPRP
jgi:predicted small lipoprotein YifL